MADTEFDVDYVKGTIIVFILSYVCDKSGR